MNVSLSGLGFAGTAHESGELNFAIAQKALRITMSTHSTGDYSVKEIKR